MHVHNIFFVLAVLAVLAVLQIPDASAFLEQGWQNLFCKIGLVGSTDIIECDNMKDTLMLQSGANVTISLNPATDTITFGLKGVGSSNVTKLDDLTDVTITSPIYGHILQFSNSEWVNKLFKANSITCSGTDKISGFNNQTGLYICSADQAGTGGDGNTAQIVSAGGMSIWKSRDNATQNTLYGLTSGPNISLTLNPNDIQITGTNTAQIVSAGGTSLFKSRDNATQNTIKGLTTSRGITLTGNTNDVQVDTNFKVNSVSPATRQFLVSFNNATNNGNFGTLIFGVNSFTTNCSGSDKVSSVSLNNSTGIMTITCSADQGLTSAITSLNGDTASSQTLLGTSRNITVTDTGVGQLTFNLGDLAVMVGGAAQTITKQLTANALVLGGALNAASQSITNIGALITDSADPADTGKIRLGNNEGINWEQSPAGTDISLIVDSNENFVFDTIANNINLNSNPLINTNINIDNTGNVLTSNTPAIGDILKSDGTEFQKFARGTAGTCLKVNAAGTDLEYGSCGSGGGFSSANNVGSGQLAHIGVNQTKLDIKRLSCGIGLNCVNGSASTANTIATNFKVNSQSPATRQFLVSFNNATTSGNFGTVTFGSNTFTQTCSGTDKVSSIAYNNATGVTTVTCSADQTGTGGGSGIPKPTQASPKKWGQVIPVSATLDLLGLLQSAALDGTETYTYNTARNTGVISSATGTSAGGNAGVSVLTANRDTYRRDQNSYLYVDYSMSAITGNRIFIGFASSNTLLPNNLDTIVDSTNAFGVCIRTTDTAYQRCENDGVGTGTYTSLGVTEDTNFHTVEVYAESANNRWCVRLDGGTPSCATTDIPAATQRLFLHVSGETSDTTGKNFIYSNIYVENDR